MRRKYGYIRVSTKDQNSGRQYQAMEKMGVDKKNIYEDKMSGYSFSRPAYKKIDIQVIDMPLLNTDSENEGLTGMFISDLVLQILAYVAETERSFIKQRQAEGIAIAKANGMQFGREKKELPEEFESYYKMWKDGKISVREAGKVLGISHTTFYRRCKEREAGKCKKCRLFVTFAVYFKLVITITMTQ